MDSIVSNDSQPVRFGIFTDLHHDVMHDGQERLKTFIDRMNEEDVDFIIQLGDFCHPSSNNFDLLNIWKHFNGPKYHVLGNHDMDHADKKTIMDFLGMEKNYYSFDCGPVHFIVLDANFLKINGDYIDFANANFYRPREECPFLNDQQLHWLKEDLAKTNKHTIIFSHQSLENEEAGINNAREVQSVLSAVNAKAGYQKVVACMNGHHHLDHIRTIDDIYYIDINSISNHWIGEGYEHIRYSKEIDEKYPYLKSTVPYKDPLFAIVTIQSGHVSIEGTKSEFVGASPLELGHNNISYGHEIKSIISDRTLPI
ncbi:metallophosphoesterase family protein [Bacillus sp. SD088]|uniref:metallophosphoesterase family protein n=1 Tax=Bacillus sp. SD088 TaxID=2782012 RepID=UPI001A9782F5|nr:metallophosphoesterase [Bacillus sp. SD088]MBO0991503.1 metallophosphoesterase [Bacillus sp. SD088]